jgi:hypothetical protein
LSPELRDDRTGPQLHHLREDSQMETPPLAPNNVVELVPSTSSSFRTTR